MVVEKAKACVDVPLNHDEPLHHEAELRHNQVPQLRRDEEPDN